MSAIRDLLPEARSTVAARIALRLLWCGRTPAEKVFEEPSFWLPGFEEATDDETAATQLIAIGGPIKLCGAWRSGSIVVEVGQPSGEPSSLLQLIEVDEPSAELICWFAGTGFRVRCGDLAESERRYHVQGGGFTAYFGAQQLLRPQPLLPGIKPDDLMGVSGILLASGEPVEYGGSAPVGRWAPLES